MIDFEISHLHRRIPMSWSWGSDQPEDSATTQLREAKLVR